MPVKLAIFASGGGSNARSIMDYFEHKDDKLHVTLLVSNKPEAGALSHASACNVPTVVISNKEMRENPNKILKVLDANQIDAIALAGFLALIPAQLTERYAGRILNIHPSLLPKYGGKGMYGIHVHRAVVEAGEEESGISIHQVNQHYDEGEIRFQRSLPLEEGETPESLQKRVLKLEHFWYPRVIEQEFCVAPKA